MSTLAPLTAAASRPAEPASGRTASCTDARALSVPSSASPVARASEGGDEERDVVVAVFELELKLDPREERRRRMEDDAIGARREVIG